MEHNFTKSKNIERCVNIKKIKLKIYNKFNLYNIKKVKNLIFWFFWILKSVTKRECVTSKVRKDPRGNCIRAKILINKKSIHRVNKIFDDYKNIFSFNVNFLLLFY